MKLHSWKSRSLGLTAIVFTITSLSLAQYKEISLYNFTYGNDGGAPDSLVADAAGNLYGTASGGPVTSACPYTCGVVFELSKASGRWVETVLYSFTGGADGEYPTGIVLDAVGNIYGLTQGDYFGGKGGGTAFKLLRHSGTGWKFVLLHTLGSVSGDGFEPDGSPTLDAAGNFYATTYQGGTGPCTNGCGTIFELSPTPYGVWKETIIHNFAGGTTDGEFPAAGPTFDSAGNLFGTTGDGGSSGCGTVFEFSPASGGWNYNIIHNFVCSPTDGYAPEASLMIDSSGNIYGTTYSGGSIDNSGCYGYCGTVFEVSPVSGGWSEKVLHNFNYTTDGALPVAGVAMDSAGKLYGTTRSGGGAGFGTVYKLSSDLAGQWRLTELYNGGDFASGVVLDSAGDIFTSNTTGGTHNAGMVFKLAPPTN